MKHSFSAKQKRSLLAVLLAVAALGCLFFVLIKNRKNELQKTDYQQISSMEYDSVFLSMYPINTYQEEDYAYFKGMTLLKSSYNIPSLSVLKDYMREITDSGNHVTTVYLGIQPELINTEKLQTLLSLYPGITFEIVISYPSADYWQSLTQKDYEQTLKAYCDLLTAAPGISQANFYFFSAQEWLICNPGNYLDTWSVKEDVARILMAYSDIGHEFLVTADNAADSADMLKTLTYTLRTAPQTYPDLMDHCIVFFGDSVIGNYTDSTSIPKVVSGLTGAEVYNCGYGGSSATTAPGITDAFFRRDLSALPKDTQVYVGISSYMENASSGKKTCFVLNYGLNDYFTGVPVSSENPYDIDTYSGAIRATVTLIREKVPDAQIILCTPNFTPYFQNGTEPHGTDGFVMTDYVDAIIALSQELGTDVLDNYHELGITPENQGQYLLDQVHPNHACRFLIGSNLVDIL